MTPEIARALAQARTLADEAAVATAYDRLAREIEADFAGTWPVIVCVMVGALYATAEITRRLGFDFELDYLHATRYRGQTSGADLHWKASPGVPLEGRHVLVIDDILDEGHTLAGIQASLRAQQPASLRTAVLVEKEHRRRDPQTSAEYVGLRLPDEYLVGCGMDYRNFGRQLTHIAAVAL